MNIRFLGVGAAFATAAYRQSNMLITASSGRRLLLDCGSDARFALAEEGRALHDLLAEIDGVYISHPHADHIGGMEWYAITTYFAPNLPRPLLIVEEGLAGPLWENSLRGGLRCIEGRVMSLADYFDCRRVCAGEPFEWEGLTMTAVRMPHVMTGAVNMYSFGLIIEGGSPGGGVFVTTDTQFAPELLEEIEPRVELIFHDCETTTHPTGVHAHYDQLRTLPARMREKMWLYHYHSSPPQDPVADGFPGFVVRGQEFRFGWG